MPKIVDHEQYRRQLLQQSFDLFAEKGYGSITMRQIAKGLAVSTGTLYHYFPSKEILFEQLVEELERQDMLQVTEQLQTAQTLSDRLMVGFEFLEKHRHYFFKQLLIYLDFYQHQDRESSTGTLIFQQMGKRVRARIAEMFDIHDPEILDFILSFVDGLLVSHLYYPDGVSFVQQGKLLTKMLTIYLEDKE
ncbi:MAG: TetR/AcrR family transcriptional regulator [Leptolyngbyaceae bacterium]|nr:TetR/AcrR family transcriptional regulator [Leptolyngbyaceae bacterium]